MQYAKEGESMIAKKSNDTEKILISVKEACQLTGVSEKTMRDLSYELNIQARIGKRVLIHKGKLEKWIEEQVS